MAYNLEMFLRQLENYGPLGADDRSSIMSLPFSTQHFKKQQYIAHQGDLSSHLLIVSSGFAVQQNITGSGSRQILALNVQGDMLNIASMFLEKLDSEILALRSSDIIYIQKDAFIAAFTTRPAIAYAIFVMSLAESRLNRAQILNIGRRDARARIANFLCTHVERMQARQLMPDGIFDMPMTQEQIGDATGLTAVHVNRMIKSFVLDGIISLSGRSVKINSYAGLKEIGDYI